VLVARLWRNPLQSGLATQRVVHDSHSSARSTMVRSTAAWLAGDFARSAAIAQAVDAPAGATGLALAVADALRHLVEGDAAAARLAVQRGQAISTLEAIHGRDAWLLLLHAAAALMQDEPASAREHIDAASALPLRRGDRAFVHFLQAWRARSAGEPGEALRQARNAAAVAVEAGLPWLECLARLTMAPLLAAAGEGLAAEAQLRGVQNQVHALGSKPLLMVWQLTQAAVAVQGGDEAAALAPLQAGMVLARDLGAHHVPGLPPATVAALCETALRRGIAVEHTRLLISAGRLPPPASALRSRRWPWALEICTLGGFDLRRGGSSIEFSAKGPGRPVELLKVLVSMGGQNVRVEPLSDALWPHVEADYAHKSFTATLHRLRRILGGDDLLRLSDGRLSLNATQIWLDTWALEQLLSDLDTCLRADDQRAADSLIGALLDELLLLYRGPFLPEEETQPAYIARREQQRARVLRVVGRSVRRWEDAGRHDTAVDCYLRCIDADELCEAFYRNLMLCHQRQGDLAEALATYDRLQAVMAARLKCAPSPETQAIRAALRR
jgi:DNA-binding SARP family transcriptional activator